MLEKLIASATAAVIGCGTVIGASAVTFGVRLGDGNVDYVVNITDASIVAAHVKSQRQLEDKLLPAADVNLDGVINVSDIILISAYVKGNAPIDEQFVTIESGSDEHIYRVFDMSMSWTEARDYCEKMGGHLVTIGSAEEQEKVEALMKERHKNNLWIGLEYDGSSWKWLDDTEFVYTHWAPDQPDGETNGENCGQIYSATVDYEDWTAEFGSWNDCRENGDEPGGVCTVDTFGFICEWDQ